MTAANMGEVAIRGGDRWPFSEPLVGESVRRVGMELFASFFLSAEVVAPEAYETIFMSRIR